jgi:hypothetical protein
MNRRASHTMWDSPTHPWGHNPVHPLSRLNAPPPTKHKQWTVIYHQQQRWGWNTESALEKGWGKEPNSQCQTVRELMQANQQRLRDGVGWQANLPQELLAPSRGQERHKDWEWGWGDRPTSERGVGGRFLSWSWGTESSIENLIAPPCWGRSWKRAAAEGQHSCHLVKTTKTLTSLHELADLPHLPIATKSVDRRTKYYSQASHQMKPHKSICLYANIMIGHQRNNSRTIKILNFLLFLNLVFFSCGFYQLITTLHLSSTHSWPIDKPTVPTVDNPSPLQSLTQEPSTQQQKYTQTHTRATKPSSPHNTSYTHPPLYLYPLLVPPLPISQISISILITITPLPQSHCL